MNKYNDFSYSPKWQRLFEGCLGKPETINLENFRSTDPVFLITTWDPNTNGLKYLKTLLYYFMLNSSSEDIEMLRQIPNRSLGNPISVNVKGVEVCFDYFQAINEVKMIRNYADLPQNAKIVEIGPGYGRTCHALLSILSEVNEYWMVDLEPSLNLAKRYLSSVLGEDLFSKIKFVKADEFQNLRLEKFFNLAINIDSFGDFPQSVIENYLSFIDDSCDYFFCKNPLGKYKDSQYILDKNSINPFIDEALQTGLLKNIIDIYNDEEINKAIPIFLEVYSPSNRWAVVSSCLSVPWTFYYQALFKKNEK